MTTFWAILKIVLLSTFVSAVLGAISGYIYSSDNQGHPHQMIPIWLLMGIINVVFSLGISLICSFIFRNNLDENLIKAVVISAIGSEILMLALIIL